MSKHRKRRAQRSLLAAGNPGYLETAPRQPVQVPPVHVPLPQDVIARPPVIDKYPIVIGQNLTGSYVSSAMRLCTQGWRYAFVDLLNELLEADPDARGVVRARVLGVACGRHDVLPADIKKDDPDYERAKEVAQEYGEQFKSIPKLQQRTAQLLWGDIYGVSGSEIIWDLNGRNWELCGLSHIHSRRLNYPDPSTWDIHIYDQGLVGPGLDYMGPTTGAFGLRVSRFPGKFIIHTPALNGDYPTRDGEGRYIAYALLFKRMLTRCTVQDFERVIKPRVIGYFNRRLAEGTTRSIANPEDEEMLDAVVRALAAGGLISGTLPDSTKVDVIKQVSDMKIGDFMDFLVRGFAKSMLGQSFTTEPGPNGNLATAEQAAKDTQKLFRYSSRCLCDTFEEDSARVWMALNHPDAPRRLLPRHMLYVDELPSPEQYAQMVGGLASKLPEVQRRVDIDDLGEKTGIKILSEEEAREMWSQPANLPKLTPPDTENGEGGDQQTQQGTPPKNGAPKTANGKQNGKALAPAPEA